LSDRHLGHADLIPDRYQFQADENVDKVDFFPENFNMLSKILKNNDTLGGYKSKKCVIFQQV
jgi:hypothetical protein